MRVVWRPDVKKYRGIYTVRRGCIEHLPPSRQATKCFVFVQPMIPPKRFDIFTRVRDAQKVYVQICLLSTCSPMVFLFEKIVEYK